MARLALPSFTLLVILAVRAGAQGPEVAPPAAPVAPLLAVPKSGSQPVHVGIYLKQLPEVDIKSNRFFADFYLWFRWKGELDPTRTWEFANAVESWNFAKVPVYTDASGAPHAEVLPDGSRYQVYRVQGRFAYSFELKDYPFDEQEIALQIEDAEHSLDELHYLVDQKETGLHPGIDVPGFVVHPPTVIAGPSFYRTNFGDTRRANDDSYSRFTFSVRLSRPLWGYLAKTVLPIVIVIMTTLVVFLVGLKYFEGRLALSITALISAVALQLTLSSNLPSVGYLVLLDKIYNLAYAIIFLTLVESVIAVRLADAGRERRSVIFDRCALAGLGVAFFGGVAAIIGLR